MRPASLNVGKPTALLETMLLFGALVDSTPTALGKWSLPSSRSPSWQDATLAAHGEPQAGMARNELIALISLFVCFYAHLLFMARDHGILPKIIMFPF